MKSPLFEFEHHINWNNDTKAKDSLKQAYKKSLILELSRYKEIHKSLCYYHTTNELIINILMWTSAIFCFSFFIFSVYKDSTQNLSLTSLLLGLIFSGIQLRKLYYIYKIKKSINNTKEKLDYCGINIYCDTSQKSNLGKTGAENSLLFWAGDSSDENLVQIPVGLINFKQYKLLFKN